jgi:hypothetical protein
MFVVAIPKDIEIMFRLTREEFEHLILLFKTGSFRYDDEDVPEDAIQTMNNFVTALSDVQKGLTDGA